MMEINVYLQLFSLVFLFNIVPAFAPPTWIVLAYFKIKNPDMNTIIILILGLVSATLGRMVMYSYSHYFSKFLPEKNKEGLEFIGELSRKSGLKVFFGSFLYSLSPFSSNIMFIFSGAGNIDAIPLFLGFFFGRLISYGLALIFYVKTFSLIQSYTTFDISRVSDIITLLIAIGMMFIDWKGIYIKIHTILKVHQ